MSVLLGAIADDFTGATDLCNTLVRRGMRTVQLIDVPAPGTAVVDAEAVVVALKSRTTPAAEAIEKSLAALAWLQRAGARQILFKYCSTFDSTDAGNIGPVAEALMDVLGTDFTLFCPAFPENGRTIYLGYLFVGDVLLSESGKRDHPLTPMRDPSLVRVLQRQARGNVGLVPHYDVARGPVAIRDAFASLRPAGSAPGRWSRRRSRRSHGAASRRTLSACRLRRHQHDPSGRAVGCVLQPARHGGAVDQERQERRRLDPAVLPPPRRQRGQAAAAWRWPTTSRTSCAPWPYRRKSGRGR
jgi:Sugar-binding N-terminal domain